MLRDGHIPDDVGEATPRRLEPGCGGPFDFRLAIAADAPDLGPILEDSEAALVVGTGLAPAGGRVQVLGEQFGRRPHRQHDADRRECWIDNLGCHLVPIKRRSPDPSDHGQAQQVVRRNLRFQAPRIQQYSE